VSDDVGSLLGLVNNLKSDVLDLDLEKLRVIQGHQRKAEDADTDGLGRQQHQATVSTERWLTSTAAVLEATATIV
jgi:hypothetical protein